MLINWHLIGLLIAAAYGVFAVSRVPILSVVVKRVLLSANGLRHLAEAGNPDQLDGNLWIAFVMAHAPEILPMVALGTRPSRPKDGKVEIDRFIRVLESHRDAQRFFMVLLVGTAICRRIRHWWNLIDFIRALTLLVVLVRCQREDGSFKYINTDIVAEVPKKVPLDAALSYG